MKLSLFPPGLSWLYPNAKPISAPRYRCDHCPARLVGGRELGLHLPAHCRLTPLDPPLRTPRQFHVCPRCGFTTVDSTEAARHRYR